VTLDRDDLDHLHYGNAPGPDDNTPVWLNLTGGSLRVVDGARRIKSGETVIYGIPVREILSIAEEMAAGKIYEPVIAAGTPDDRRIVMVEGWARVTAFALVESRQHLGAMLASEPRVRNWAFYLPPG
jgi:hypothetical protein